MFINAMPSSTRAMTRGPARQAETQSTNELERRVLGPLVVAGDEAIEGNAVNDGVGHCRGKGVVERFDDMDIGVALLNLLSIGYPVKDLAGVVEIHMVGGVDDHLAVDSRAQVRKTSPKRS